MSGHSRTLKSLIFAWTAPSGFQSTGIPIFAQAAPKISLLPPIFFASFLVIVLINSYFLILATVQADATVCAKIFIFPHEFHLPPLNLVF